MAKITLIGSGNVATALGRAFVAAGHTIAQVWSRGEAGASALAAVLHCPWTTNLSALHTDTDIYILAVKDDAAAAVASQMDTGSRIIAHTSGITPIAALAKAGPNYGVFYPFVSMTKDTAVDFRRVLLLIEGSNEKTLEALRALGSTILGSVRPVEQGRRQSLHLAAVFANNFTNHLYIVAERILKEQGMEFDYLRPLIAAHLSNLMAHSPSHLQTGPAIRRDHTAISAHLELLGQNNEFKQLYLTLTQAIQEWDKEKG